MLMRDTIITCRNGADKMQIEAASPRQWLSKGAGLCAGLPP